MEGTCNGKYGFVLSVLNVLDTGRGLIREGSGSAVFNLTYSCICFKPFKGEVLDVVVTSVNKVNRPSPRGRARGMGPARCSAGRDARSSWQGRALARAAAAAAASACRCLLLSCAAQFAQLTLALLPPPA